MYVVIIIIILFVITIYHSLPQAFPCISTGVYGYPNAAACNVALRTTRQFLEEHHAVRVETGDSSHQDLTMSIFQKVERIIFCLFLPRDVELYKQRLPLMFPTKKEEDK